MLDFLRIDAGNMANFTMGVAAPVTPQMDFGYDPISGMSWGDYRGAGRGTG